MRYIVEDFEDINRRLLELEYPLKLVKELPVCDWNLNDTITETLKFRRQLDEVTGLRNLP